MERGLGGLVGLHASGALGASRRGPYAGIRAHRDEQAATRCSRLNPQWRRASRPHRGKPDKAPLATRATTKESEIAFLRGTRSDRLL